ncbi:MAG: luxQ 3 [Planctomycetaceae bacterium]|nr:luxQ 3 [Planctomycetaceae bacterium]
MFPTETSTFVVQIDMTMRDTKFELLRSRILLSEALSRIIEIARPKIESMGHELITDLPVDPIVLDADESRLKQIFLNLLSNSAKFTAPGGQIWVTAKLVGNEVVVSVRDNGIGIPSENLPKIFDIFSRISRSREPGTGSFGLGVVQFLVEMHGGTVTATSGGKDQGSEFTVRLPVIHESL